MPDTNEERPLIERQLVWRARRKLKRVRREGRTGLLAYSVIPSSNRSGYRYLRFVYVREGGRELHAGSVDNRAVTWTDLPPGVHRLTFVVSDAGKEVSFQKDITLGPGQILAVWCYTTYSLKVFDRNPRPNRWYIGVLGGQPKQ